MTLQDLETLSIDQLSDVITRAEDTRTRLIADRKATLRADFEERLRVEGFAIADVICSSCPKAGQGSVKPKRKTMPPKYGHPDKPDLTWSGLGRKPGWLQGLLEEGRNLHEMLLARID